MSNSACVFLAWCVTQTQTLQYNVDLMMATSANGFLWGKLAFVSEQEVPLGPFRGRTNTCVEQQNVPPVRRRPTGHLGQSVFFSEPAEYDLCSMSVICYYICICKEVVLHITIMQLGLWLPSAASNRGETNHREGFLFNSCGFVLQSNLGNLLSLKHLMYHHIIRFSALQCPSLVTLLHWV